MKTIESNCKHCSVPFQVRPAEINRGNGLFCSSSCSSKDYRARTHKTPESNCVCAQCSARFYVKLSRLNKPGPKYCSARCQGKARTNKNAEARRINQITEPRFHKRCLECEKELTKNQKKNYNQTYCSASCGATFRHKIKIQKWITGDFVFNPRSETIPHTIRRYLFEKHHSKCPKCGWGEIHPTTGRVPLTVNHIDGDSSNHSHTNVELLCPNCHSLTPNYGSLNRGKGRKRRMNVIRLSKSLI
jgi:5-methylcytosine-specific restriction endonuclease McrA